MTKQVVGGHTDRADDAFMTRSLAVDMTEQDEESTDLAWLGRQLSGAIRIDDSMADYLRQTPRFFGGYVFDRRKCPELSRAVSASDSSETRKVDDRAKVSSNCVQERRTTGRLWRHVDVFQGQRCNTGPARKSVQGISLLQPGR